MPGQNWVQAPQGLWPLAPLAMWSVTWAERPACPQPSVVPSTPLRVPGAPATCSAGGGAAQGGRGRARSRHWAHGSTPGVWGTARTRGVQPGSGSGDGLASGGCGHGTVRAWGFKPRSLGGGGTSPRSDRSGRSGVRSRVTATLGPRRSERTALPVRAQGRSSPGLVTPAGTRCPGSGGGGPAGSFGARSREPCLER